MCLRTIAKTTHAATEGQTAKQGETMRFGQVKGAGKCARMSCKSTSGLWPISFDNKGGNTLITTACLRCWAAFCRCWQEGVVHYRFNSRLRRRANSSGLCVREGIGFLSVESITPLQTPPPQGPSNNSPNGRQSHWYSRRCLLSFLCLFELCGCGLCMSVVMLWCVCRVLFVCLCVVVCFCLCYTFVCEVCACFFVCYVVCVCRVVCLFACVSVFVWLRLCVLLNVSKACD